MPTPKLTQTLNLSEKNFEATVESTVSKKKKDVFVMSEKIGHRINNIEYICVKNQN